MGWLGVPLVIWILWGFVYLVIGYAVVRIHNIHKYGDERWGIVELVFWPADLAWVLLLAPFLRLIDKLLFGKY